MENNIPKLSDASAGSQRLRILAALRLGPKTTFDLIRECNAVRPGARITELRQRGYRIDTVPTEVVDDYGRRHGRVALYVLQREVQL